MGRAVFDRYWNRRYAEKLSYPQAIELLKKHIPEFTGQNVTKELINKYRKELARKYHPDTGYVGDDLGLLNTALDILEQNPGGGSVDDNYDRPYRPERREKQEVPIWAWAGYSGGLPPQASISRESFEDINYIKKKAWEISGSNPKPSKHDEYTFHNFDGRYGRGMFTVYASEDTLKTIAGWMPVWDHFNRSKAILVSNPGFDRYMVFPVTGSQIGESIGFIESDSFNKNPFNDPHFERHLNQMLEREVSASQVHGTFRFR